MLRSWIGKVFAVALVTPQTAQNCVHDGFWGDGIEPQNAFTHQRNTPVGLRIL